MTKKSVRIDIPANLWEESKVNFSYYNIGKEEFLKLTLEIFLEKKLGFHTDLLNKLVENGRFSKEEAEKRIILLKQLELSNDIYCDGEILEVQKRLFIDE